MQINKTMRNTTMFTRLLIPMIFIFILQVSGIVFMVINAGIFTKTIQQAYVGLNEKVKGRKNYIEGEIANRWIDFSDMPQEIVKIIDTKLEQKNLTLADISKDPKKEVEIFGEIFPKILFSLKNNSSTGMFFILNSPKGQDANQNSFYPGIYLWDTAPASYSSTNKDILLARGNLEIAKTYGVQVNIDYEENFLIGADENLEDDKFFHNPIVAAKNYNTENPNHLSYWSLPLKDPLTGIEFVTYSIPIVNKDGKIYGVLGIDLTLDYLRTFFDFEELIPNRRGIYALAISTKTDKGRTLKTIIANASATNMGLMQSLTFDVVATDNPNMYVLEDKEIFGRRQCVSVHHIDLYPKNSVYENYDWVVLGIAPERFLLSTYYDIKNIFIQFMVIATILFSVGAFLSSRHISGGLAKVIVQLEQSDNTKPIKIERINIKEIDSLISAIENLSVDIFNEASRVSKIVEQVEVPTGVFEHNTRLGTVFCNARWFKLFNINKYEEDVTLQDVDFYKILDDLEYYVHSKTKNKVVYAIPSGKPGMVRWVRFTRVYERDMVLGVATDITKETKERSRLEIQMNYDELTGLYNRYAFDRQISEIFKKENIGICALVTWDIDDLKSINDRFGHSFGDSFVQVFAKKLLSLQQDRCLVARKAGNEFCTLFHGYSTSDEIRLLLNAFWKDLQNLTIQFPTGEDTRLRVSAGMAWFPYDADNYEDLIRFSDFAVYNVKNSYKGLLKEFDMENYKKNYLLVSGTEAFNQMIEKQLIDYALQPILDARTGDVYGYEMLMRPLVQEFQNPEIVLQIAKAQSKLYKIEELTFFLGMETFVNKIESGEISRDSKIFLNTISSQIISDLKIAEFERRFKPYLSNIVLEITEGEPLNTTIYSIKNQKIQEWNAMIAIDDFGSGYSNDSSLVFLSPHLVKIDMSIVRDIHKNWDKQHILENLVSYAKKRGIIILAEGVECVEEVDTLIRFGVDLFQGHFFSKPLIELSPVPEDRKKILTDIYADT